LFGSDNPYVPLGETVEGIARLGPSTADFHATGCRKNAINPMPHLRTISACGDIRLDVVHLCRLRDADAAWAAQTFGDAICMSSSRAAIHPYAR
jgi:hypothetical protein